MEEHTIANLEAVIDFIEDHLDEKLDLERVAAVAHYSKYHLHRLFSAAVGMTIHDYVGRRQLTEAAKLLVFSEKPIIDIALRCGYESQQAFSAAFKAMYKVPPAEYRARRAFYPLQLRFTLHQTGAGALVAEGAEIRPAQMEDIPRWMELVRLVIDGYPCLDEAQYREQLSGFIRRGQALMLKVGDRAVGVMAFSGETGSIEFLGIHPQYRSCGLEKRFLAVLMEDYLPGREISMTTYRANDRADVGHRAALKRLGFAERELLVEFGYPTQRFVLPPTTGGERPHA